jgi:hypothetical protein
MLLFFLGSSTEQNCAALAARQRAPTMAATEQIQEGRCLGRLVRNDPKGVWMLPLEEPGTGAVKNWFHIPYRCEKREIKGGLCEFCIAKERRTAEHLEAAGGGMVKRGLHSGMLHGRVGEPIPPWSRIFGGEWYNLKLAAGCTVSAETMARAKKAVAATGQQSEAEGSSEAAEATAVAVAAVQKPKGKPGRKPKAATATEAAAGPVQTKLSIAELRKAAAEQKAAASTPVVAAPTPSPAPVVTAPKPAPKKMTPKKAGAAAPAAPSIGIAEAFVEQTTESPVEDVVEIKVRRLELDGGRSYYLDSKKQKVYDMKFKYVGRYSAEKAAIDRSFPDSDAEC